MNTETEQFSKKALNEYLEWFVQISTKHLNRPINPNMKITLRPFSQFQGFVSLVFPNLRVTSTFPSQAK